jgi:DNA-binding MarR family transcriptional regulator
MARDSHLTREVLDQVSRDDRLTQRSLSHRLGISLGLVNVYLKRLARKGYLKITTVPGKRLLRYMLTPQGFAEKARLTYEFAEYSLRFLRLSRAQMRQQFQRLKQHGAKRVVMCGCGELAELAYLAMAEARLELAAVVTSDGQPASFLGRIVRPLADLPEMEFDAVVTFSEEDRQAARAMVGEDRPVLLTTAAS